MINQRQTKRKIGEKKKKKQIEFVAVAAEKKSNKRFKPSVEPNLGGKQKTKKKNIDWEEIGPETVIKRCVNNNDVDALKTQLAHLKLSSLPSHLSTAATRGCHDVIDLLVSQVKNANRSLVDALWIAAENGRSKVFFRLLDAIRTRDENEVMGSKFRLCAAQSVKAIRNRLDEMTAVNPTTAPIVAASNTSTATASTTFAASVDATDAVEVNVFAAIAKKKAVQKDDDEDKLFDNNDDNGNNDFVKKTRQNYEEIMKTLNHLLY